MVARSTAHGQRRSAALCPAQTFAQETEILLRSRLRAYSLICLAMLCFFFVLSLFTDNLLLLGIRFLILLVIAICHAIVRRKGWLQPGRLRVLELVILFATVAQLTMMMAARMLHFAAVGDPITLAAVQQGYMGAWVLLVLTYGLFIPIPWRRAAALLLPVGFVPGLLSYVLARARGDVASMFIKDQAPEFVVLPIVAAVVAVYAAHTIYRIRETAFEGRRFGQYVLGEQIGGGGMGQVYRADHVLLKRPCHQGHSSGIGKSTSRPLPASRPRCEPRPSCRTLTRSRSMILGGPATAPGITSWSCCAA